MIEALLRFTALMILSEHVFAQKEASAGPSWGLKVWGTTLRIRDRRELSTT